MLFYTPAAGITADLFVIRMMHLRFRHAFWPALVIALASFAPSNRAISQAPGPQGATLGDLYEIAQPVESSREAAFAEALKAVLVRVSGQRDAPARLAPELDNPRKYVQRFGFTEDNVLQVGFDSVSIDRLLSQAGLPVWGRERPATLVALGVDDGGAVRWVSAQASPSARDAIARAAYERGLPLVWAAMDAQDQSSVGFEAAGSQDSWLQAAQRYGAHAALLGRMRDGSIQWTLISRDGVERAVGGHVDGVHLAADAFARVFAAAGGSYDTVVIEVAGVNDLDAYAATLNYLESMTLVRNVAVEQAAGDVLRFRLAVRGDAETLRRAIGLDNRLLPLAPSALDPATDVERLSFRFNR